MSKVTLKDIAKEANVSVATVSYILNNVTNQTIPYETKCRVLDIAKQLHYVPNLTAKSLAKGKTNLIGILINRNDEEGFWRGFYYHEFVNRLERSLTAAGYHVIVSSVNASNPNLDIILQRKLDGVFLIDVNKDVFYDISNKFSFGVPLVVIDSYIDDNLFHKVLFDFRDAISKAKNRLSVQNDDFFLITDTFNNQGVMDEIRNTSSLEQKFIYRMDRDEEGLIRFLRQNANKKGIIINEFIGAMVSNYTNPSEIAVICTCDCSHILPPQTIKISFENKAYAAFEVMMKHLNNHDFEGTNKYILIEAD